GLCCQARGARSEAEAELAADLWAERTAFEIGARRCAIVAVPEAALVVRGGLLEQCELLIAGAAPRLLGRRGLFVLEGNPEALGEPLDRADEVDALGLLDERDHVAALAAAETVVEPVDRVHGEARCALLVEGAAADEPAAGLA